MIINNKFSIFLLVFTGIIGSVQAATYNTYGISYDTPQSPPNILFSSEGSFDSGFMYNGNQTAWTKIFKEGTPSVFAGVNNENADAGGGVESHALLRYRATIIGSPNTIVGLGFKGFFELHSSVGEIGAEHRSTASVNVSLVSELPSDEASPEYPNTGFRAVIQNELFANFLYPTSIEFTKRASRGSAIEMISVEKNGLVWQEDYNKVYGLFGGVLRVPIWSDGMGLVDVFLDVSASILGTIDFGKSDFATAYLDPYLYIDPSYLADHPETRLEVEPGIGNDPVAISPPTNPIPEPSSTELIGCALLLISKFRKKFYV